MSGINSSIKTALLVSIMAIASPVYASPLFEPFDKDPAPALPAQWEAASNTSSIWVSTTAERSSEPNSAFAPGLVNLTDTSLTTPSQIIPGAGGPVNASLIFAHKYFLETVPGSEDMAFDGAVVEVSINGGPFQDILAAGGAFNFGSYQHTISDSNQSPIAGRRAWSGITDFFGITSINLPPINAGVPFKIRWRLVTDNGIPSPGWYIDNVRIELNSNTAIKLTPAVASILEGQSITFNAAITNKSTADTENPRAFLFAPSSNTLGPVTILNGAVTTLTGGYLVELPGTLHAGETKNFSVVVQTTKPRAPSAKITLLDPIEVAGIETGAVLTSFSAPIPAGGIEAATTLPVDDIGSPNDLCESSSTPLTGQIAYVSDITGCSITTKALNVQKAGAIALILLDNSNSEFFPTFFKEPANPEIKIPVMSIETFTSNYVYSALQMRISGGVDIVALQGYLEFLSGDKIFADNSNFASAALLADSDSDGSADVNEQCPTDANKTVAGSCGCNVPDSDSNGNAIPDCLKNADFKAQLALAKSLLRKLSIDKTKTGQSTLTTQLNLIISGITAATQAGSGVAASSTNVNLLKLGKATNKALKRALKRKNTFSDDRKKAGKALKQLIKGIGA